MPISPSFFTIRKKYFKYHLVLFTLFLLGSCNSNNTSDDAVTENYILITEAIRSSKKSRSNFQNSLTSIADSVMDNGKLDTNFIACRQLLDSAKKENEKALSLVTATEEADSSIPYKQKALELFNCLETQYQKDYPEMLDMLQSNNKDKKTLFLHQFVASYDTLKSKAIQTIDMAKKLVNKYHIRMIDVTDEFKK